jgi:hypothetical protein
MPGKVLCDMSILGTLSLALQLVIGSPAQVGANADQQLVDGILEEVSQLRNLKVLRTVPAVSHSREQILGYVGKRINEEYPGQALELEAALLKHLGLIPQQLDYRGTLKDFVTAQVAGYFDPFKDRFVLASWLGSLMQRPIIAHELTHALQHQHFGLKSALKRIPENDDATIARSAVIEGDATITMVVHLMIALEKSGFSGVDALHRSPPASTEQLLHPERYPADQPIAVDFTLSQNALKGYKVALRNRLGEMGMRFLVSPTGKREAEAKELANGWGGDRYAFLTKGKSSAFVAAVATDDQAAAKRYRRLLEISLENRYSKPPKISQKGSVSSDGYTLTWRQEGRCLAWVEAPLDAPATSWLAAATQGCLKSK